MYTLIGSNTTKEGRRLDIKVFDTLTGATYSYAVGLNVVDHRFEFLDVKFMGQAPKTFFNDEALQLVFHLLRCVNALEVVYTEIIMSDLLEFRLSQGFNSL